MKKLFCADLFCGGGGTSTGMINAFRRAGIADKDIHLIGVNHWNIAIETNKLNHPFEKLYCSTVEQVKPREAVPSGHLNFLWASPECTNHSRAKGGRPRDKQSRATAWDILKWVQELYIDRIYIENGVGAANAALIAAAPEMFTVLAGICQEKSAHICQYRPESCKVCQINKVLKKARGEQ